MRQDCPLPQMQKKIKNINTLGKLIKRMAIAPTMTILNYCLL